jgi:HEAT repeat protein/PBS lyase HEAT-like repeat-containing protein
VEGIPGASAPGEQPPLDTLLRMGRDAIQREDWNGLLEVALQLVEAQAEAPSELMSSTYRIELKRLLTRKHLAMIARLAHGERKQEVIALLRRFGADATEILMDLLVEAMSMGERRGYYSAITQMSEGTDAIVQQLGHQQWYVVRNAAELCGEMELAEGVPGLARQVNHPDERVRKAVAQALAKIATPQAAEPLRRLLDDPARAVRLQALGAMSGRRARHMVGVIGELLKKEELGDVQHEALLALGRIGSPDAIMVLKDWAAPGGRVIGRRPVALRLTAVKALAMCGGAATEALSALLKDESAEVRAAATTALEAMRP